MRIALVQYLHSPPRGRSRSRAETHRTLVINEGVAGKQMAPATRTGAQAEIVLLAVTATERFDVEQPDILQRGAPDVHAEADCGRQLNAASAIGGLAGSIQLRDAE